jgi:hypothetical protein
MALPKVTGKPSQTIQCGRTRISFSGWDAKANREISNLTEGCPNQDSGRMMSVTEKTVETRLASIVSKLDRLLKPDDFRRVLAVGCGCTTGD